MDPSDVPFYCKLCGYRATNLKLFNQHLKKSKVHLKLVKDGEGEESYMQKGKQNVTCGKADSDLIVKKEKDDEETDDENIEPELELDDPKDISVLRS